MKKRLASILLAVAFSIAAIACQPASTELSEEQKAALADSVTQLSAEMQRAFDNRDAAYFDYFSDWTTSSAAGSRAHEQNRSALLENNWPNNTQTSQSGQTRTLVLGPDAVVVERAQVNIVTGSTGETREYDVFLSELWVREDTGWKALLYRFTNLGVREPS
jgi:hypothetical protein